MLGQITPLILTFNEQANIGRSLERLKWASEVLVIDSQSSDDTLSIAGKFKNVRVVSRPFDTHANQWNYALHHAGVRSEWVLALDADYIVPRDLVDELAQLNPIDSINGYLCNFSYCVFGRPIRGSLYPPSIVLFRRKFGNYRQDGHTQRLELTGATAELSHLLQHDDRKSLSRWLSSQANYMTLEAEKLMQSHFWEQGWTGRLRKLYFVAPIVMPFYCLIIRGQILDGLAGIFYALQRTTAELVLTLKMLELRLKQRKSR